MGVWKRRITGWILALALLAGLVPGVGAAEALPGPGTVPADPVVEYWDGQPVSGSPLVLPECGGHAGLEEEAAEPPAEYGRSFLTAAEQTAYDLLKAGIAAGTVKISFPSDLTLSAAQVKGVMEMLTADHPEFFWATGGYSYWGGASRVVAVEPDYEIGGAAVSAEEIAEAKAELEAVAAGILARMAAEAGASDYEKALWLHDEVAERVTYNYGPNHQTAYGALVERQAVCAGYAASYQYLLRKAGIPAWYVRGTSIAPGGTTPVRHAWNLLWLDGKCVYTDVTWNDQEDVVYHLYFARPLSVFNTDHTVDAEYYASRLPTCTAGCAQTGYYDVTAPEGKLSGTLTAADLAAGMVRDDNGRIWRGTFLDPTGTELLAWLGISANRSALLSAIGTGGGSFGFGRRYLGGEGTGVELILTVTDVYASPVTGTVTGCGDPPAAVTLTGAGGTYTAVTDGEGNYTFSAVPDGSYTLAVTHPHADPVTKQVTVSGTTVLDPVVLVTELQMELELSGGLPVLTVWGLKAEDTALALAARFRDGRLVAVWTWTVTQNGPLTAAGIPGEEGDVYRAYLLEPGALRPLLDVSTPAT